MLFIPGVYFYNLIEPLPHSELPHPTKFVPPDLSLPQVQTYGEGNGVGGGGGSRGAPGDAAASAAVLAWVYTSSRMAQLPAEVVPTEAYMMKLREGAADQYLDPTYQVRHAQDLMCQQV